VREKTTNCSRRSYNATQVLRPKRPEGCRGHIWFGQLRRMDCTRRTSCSLRWTCYAGGSNLLGFRPNVDPFSTNALLWLSSPTILNTRVAVNGVWCPKHERTPITMGARRRVHKQRDRQARTDPSLGSCSLVGRRTFPWFRASNPRQPV